MNEEAPARKHRVYKYSGVWYAHCGKCPRTCTAVGWQSVMWGLEFHVREHRPGDPLTG